MNEDKQMWRRYLIGFPIAMVAFGAMDAAWLTLSYDRLYRPELGQIMSGRADLVASVAFYLIYLAGMTHFVIAPCVKSGGVARSLLNGALLGVMAYATYDLTNQATLKVWSIKVTVCDLAWGAVATSVASTVSTGLTRKLLKPRGLV